MDRVLFRLFEACLQKEYHDAPNDASWAYDRKGDTLFLWFQQSHGPVDWWNNLQFAAVPYREMSPAWRCHAGFLKVWKSLVPVLSPLIADPTVKRACTVGYSHGAALALLCHEYIWYHRPDLRGALCGYGYGCPRVLYGCLPPEIARRWAFFYRVCNEDDLVTHLPPRAFGYCHVGMRVSVGQTGLYGSVDAHRPQSYLTELQKAVHAQNPHADGENTY